MESKGLNAMGSTRVLICSLFLLSIDVVKASELEIRAEPERMQIRGVRSHRMSLGFLETENEVTGLVAHLKYKPTSSRRWRTIVFNFAFDDAVDIFTEDGQELYLNHKGEQIHVGRHRWWYHPRWQVYGDNLLGCTESKRLNTLEISDCKLKIPSPSR